MAANEDLVHGWVSVDCGRGTSDILWSCLTTILLCVWTVIHLPVPCCSRFESETPLEEGELVPGEPSRSWKNWIIRSGIVPAVISVIAPEFLTVTAIAEFLEARRTQKKVTQLNWTLTHAFFLHMGGFCFVTPSGLRLQPDDNELMSAISAGTQKSPHSPDWLSELRKVEETHINDHAKSNPLTKFIACSQALWLVTQVISRACQHQAVTLLEVSTLAYAACALTAYAAWWKKPQSSTLPITVLCSTEASPQRRAEYPLYYSEATLKQYIWAGQRWSRHLTIDRFNEAKDVNRTICFGLFALCPAIFGAIHIASWNIKLLTNVEQWLWRASALFCCTAGMIYILAALFLDICEDKTWIGGATAEVIEVSAAIAVSSIYVLVRLYMIVEVFLSLRALPRNAYESVQWSSFVPHV